MINQEQSISRRDLLSGKFRTGKDRKTPDGSPGQQVEKNDEQELVFINSL